MPYNFVGGAHGDGPRDPPPSSRIRGTTSSRRNSGAAHTTDDEGTLIVLSVHGPTSWDDDSGWFGFLPELGGQIVQLGALGRGDWNVDVDGDSDRLTSLGETLRG